MKHNVIDFFTQLIVAVWQTSHRVSCVVVAVTMLLIHLNYVVTIQLSCTPETVVNSIVEHTLSVLH